MQICNSADARRVGGPCYSRPRRKDATLAPLTEGHRLGEWLSILVVEAVAAFVADLELQGRAGSAKTYRLTLKPLLALGPTVAHLDTTVMRELMRQRSRELAASSLATFHAVLSSFFAWCVAEHYIAASPMVGIPKPRQRRPPHRWIPADGLRAMYQACETDTERLIMLLCGGSGLRAGELVGLRWRDVDGGHIRVLGKGRKWRELDAGPLAAALLGRLRQPDGYVTPYRWTTTLGDHVHRIAKRAGVGRCTTHQLRHSFAVAYLQLGGSAMGLQQLLGHTNGAMTLYYVRDVAHSLALTEQGRVGLADQLFGAPADK